VARIGHEIGQALGDLHSRGIVHRDVKPANIIVSDTGRTTLVDLGMAKETQDQGLTGSRELLGTAAYLAPEVIKGQAQHPGSDLYALGATLYELLTARRPFKSRGTMRLLAKICAGEPPTPPRSIRSEVPRALSELINSLLEREPAARPRDAKQICQTLQTMYGESS